MNGKNLRYKSFGHALVVDDLWSWNVIKTFRSSVKDRQQRLSFFKLHCFFIPCLKKVDRNYTKYRIFQKEYRNPPVCTTLDLYEFDLYEPTFCDQKFDLYECHSICTSLRNIFLLKLWNLRPQFIKPYHKNQADCKLPISGQWNLCKKTFSL